MKNLLFCWLFASGMVLAQGGPQIRFESTRHDYGTVQQFSEVVHMFRFSNVGDETLVIERLEPG